MSSDLFIGKGEDSKPHIHQSMVRIHYFFLKNPCVRDNFTINQGRSAQGEKTLHGTFCKSKCLPVNHIQCCHPFSLRIKRNFGYSLFYYIPDRLSCNFKQCNFSGVTSKLSIFKICIVTEISYL